MCDQLVNTCKADATARATCANAITAASSATPAKTGIQADAFNAVFGIVTDFAKDPVFDDLGNLVSGNGTDTINNTNNINGGNTGNNGSCTPTNTPANGGNNTTTNGSVENIGNFGSCSVPEIEFGVGFDNRRETSFQPVDLGESNPFLPSYPIFHESFALTSSIWGCGSEL